MAKRYQVIIIGGGPVGVGLAVNLGLRGISCVLVERRVGLSNIPKGQNLSPRTLEHFYFWGCVDQLRAERLMPRPYPISGITAYGNLMSDYWFAPPQREIVRPYYFQDVERLPQYLTEKTLRNKMLTLPNVEGRFGHADGADHRARTTKACASRSPSWTAAAVRRWRRIILSVAMARAP